MANLRAALESFLTDWRSDLPDAWRGILAGVEPDFGAIAAHLTLEPNERIFPLRKGHADPLAPAHSHMFRALDGSAPDAVRAVLLGQDPYPEIRRATGRSFEQGDLSNWQGEVAKSLRHIIQVLAEHRAPDPDYVPRDSAWPGVSARIVAGNPAIELPAGLFDRWQEAGVMCLNLGLTLSRFDDRDAPAADRVQPAHMGLWKPVVTTIVRHLAQRPGRPLLVLLWGGMAQKAVDQMRLNSARQDGESPAQLAVVRRIHPVMPAFLQLPDPFAQANAALETIGAAPINW
ncbi:MAG: hypothetical protein JNJ60_22355 [Rhodocyclaceae bacterium]|nr:hypothetical protein [Rhodocyclaceae bacterium]